MVLYIFAFFRGFFYICHHIIPKMLQQSVPQQKYFCNYSFIRVKGKQQTLIDSQNCLILETLLVMLISMICPQSEQQKQQTNKSLVDQFDFILIITIQISQFDWSEFTKTVQNQHMLDQILFINKVLNNGPYKAIQKLNEGSYGEIFKVKHHQNKKIYAMKLFQLSKIEKMNRMHEITTQTILLSKLSHPGIIKIYDTIRRKDYFGIIMEICPLGDLTKLMNLVNNKFELAKKKKTIMIYYLAQLLETISYLHDNKIIHRDIKPENVVIGQDLKIRLIDFGTAYASDVEMFSLRERDQIAKFRNQQRRQFVGSANYLSPQALELNYSEKSDVWAFGLIAYKFYYNKLPFIGEDNFQIFKSIKMNTIQHQQIQTDWLQFFNLIFQKDPSQRADLTTLKKCQLFKSLSFEQIYKKNPPVMFEQISTLEERIQMKKDSLLLEICLEKKKFFGNYQKQILTIIISKGMLIMAFSLESTIDSINIGLNDYANIINQNQFQVTTANKSCRFRVSKSQSNKAIVAKINEIIKIYYQL